MGLSVKNSATFKKPRHTFAVFSPFGGGGGHKKATPRLVSFRGLTLNFGPPSASLLYNSHPRCTAYHFAFNLKTQILNFKSELKPAFGKTELLGTLTSNESVTQSCLMTHNKARGFVVCLFVGWFFCSVFLLLF